MIWNAKTDTLKDTGYILVNRVNDTFVFGGTAGTRLYVAWGRDAVNELELCYMPVKKAPVLASSILIQKSSNTKYATVSSQGLVTAKKAGIGKTVYITATTANGKKNTRRLIIKK